MRRPGRRSIIHAPLPGQGFDLAQQELLERLRAEIRAGASEESSASALTVHSSGRKWGWDCKTGVWTPSGTGGDAEEIIVPYHPETGGELVWNVTKAALRVSTSGGSPSLRWEKFQGAGEFVSAGTLATVTLAADAHEAVVAVSGATIRSGDKVRVNVLATGTAINWCARLWAVEAG
jgi:hypothetical protein